MEALINGRKESPSYFQTRYAVLVVLIELLAIVIFCKGFLLSRTVISLKNDFSYGNSTRPFYEQSSAIEKIRPNSTDVTLAIVLDEMSHHLVRNNAAGETVPILRGKYSKIVIFVLDALRYDFALSYQGDFGNTTISKQLYHDCLPVLSRCNSLYPEYSTLASFIADPPTTSMQRISGIMSGTLPTFLEAAFNFGDNESFQDNLVHQLKAKYPTGVYFMGDDTWVNLFPKQLEPSTQEKDWTKGFSFPDYSLLLFDLNSVDDNIKRVLSKLFCDTWPSESPIEGLEGGNWLDRDCIARHSLERPPVIIAHFLGIDHCGHMYGPRSPAMASKLGEVNSVIEDTLNSLEPETLFVAFGDHGMTEEGDHGGETAKELAATIFLYSRDPLSLLGCYKKAIAKETVPDKKRALIVDYDRLVAFFRSINDMKKASLAQYSLDTALLEFIPGFKLDNLFPQLDLTATLSVLLGIAIPFSNVGVISPDLIFVESPLTNKDLSFTMRQNLLFLLSAIKLNDLQVTRYLLEMWKLGEPGFTTDFLEQYLAKSQGLDGALKALLLRSSFDITEAFSIAEKYFEHLISSSARFRSSWARFDKESIVLAIILLAMISLALLFRSPIFMNSSYRHSVILVVISVIISACIFLALHERNVLNFLGICIIVCLAYYLFKSQLRTVTLFESLSILLAILSGTLFFGNSFIIQEEAKIRYFLSSALLLYSLGSWNIKSAKLSIVSSLLFWLSGITGAPRPEVQLEYLSHRSYPNCFYDSFFPICLIFALGVLLLAMKFFLNSGLHKSMWHFCFYGVCQSLIFLKWVFTWYGDVEPTAEFVGIILPLLSKTIFVFCILGLIARPRMWFLSVLMLYGLVQRPFQGYFSFLQLYLQLPIFASLFTPDPMDKEVFHNRGRSSSLVITILYLFGMNLFFSSGHQFTISSIHWESAYAVFSDPPQIVCAVFVLFGTFFGLFAPFLYFSGKNFTILKPGWKQQYQLISIFWLFFLCTAAFLFLRHLMFWSVFAPRLLFHFVICILSPVTILCIN